MAKRMMDRMARSQAAEDMMRGQEPAVDDAAAEEGLAGLAAAGPPPMEESEAPEAGVESALAAVDAALESLPPEMAEEARLHVEAIREIAASQPKEEAPEAGEAPPPGGLEAPGAELAGPPVLS